MRHLDFYLRRLTREDHEAVSSLLLHYANEEITCKALNLSVVEKKLLVETNTMDFYLRRLTWEDREAVSSLLLHYASEEITCKALNLSIEEKKLLVETFAMQTLPQNLSVGVFEKFSNNLCGCGLHSNLDLIIREEHCQKKKISTPQLDYLLRFDEIFDNKAAEVAKTFGAKKVMMLEVLLVDPQYQTLGLADRIHVWIENEVPRMKFDMLVGVSTSYYSKKITMNHGFIVAEEMKYADYRDPITNEAIFSNIPAPHTGAAVVYKYISTSKY